MEEPRKKKRLTLHPTAKALLRPWPIYLITLGVLGGTAYFVTHREAGSVDAVLPPVVQLKQNIEIQFTDVIMQGRQHGIQRWVIQAPKVSLSKDSRYTYFEPDPKGRFFNLKDWSAPETPPPPPPPAPPALPNATTILPGGAPLGNQAAPAVPPPPPAPPVAAPANAKTRSLDWTAKKAQFDSFTEDLVLEGKAVLTTDTKDVLKTERVEYRSRDKQVVMPKPVDVQMQDGGKLKADSLKANTDAEVFELQGHVDLVAPLNDQEKL